MTSDFEINLEKYAEIIVRVALNLQPGQRLLIGAPAYDILGVPLELAPLVRLITKKAYQVGARYVDVMWEDEQLSLLRFQYAPRDSFEEYPNWRADTAFKIAEAGDALLWVVSFNPDLLNGQDPNLINKFLDIGLKRYKPLLDLRHKLVMNHTIIAPPISGWADKVFPNLPQNKRIEKFWDTIFDISCVKQKDPISAWRNYFNQLQLKCNYLNQKQYKALKFNAPGTDLTIGLPKDHIWGSARVKTKNGIDFVANFPSEEICTIPDKDKTEGVVTATKPKYLEVLLEDFKFTFTKGRVVKLSAMEGEEFLNKHLKSDDGASRLGEVALVSNSSPISQTGLLFYNALIDENASCHLALGQCLRMCIKDGEKMSDDELLAAGGNISGIHLDFMIGSDKINVDGVLENGRAEPIMRNGEWAFKV